MSLDNHNIFEFQLNSLSGSKFGPCGSTVWFGLPVVGLLMPAAGVSGKTARHNYAEIYELEGSGTVRGAGRGSADGLLEIRNITDSFNKPIDSKQNPYPVGLCYSPPRLRKSAETGGGTTTS